MCLSILRTLNFYPRTYQRCLDYPFYLEHFQPNPFLFFILDLGSLPIDLASKASAYLYTNDGSN